MTKSPTQGRQRRALFLCSWLAWGWFAGQATPGHAAAAQEPSVHEASSHCLQIGAAQADITGPAAEVGMMGYADGKQRTGGIHMRLRARAFAFNDPCQGKQLAIVIADLGMIFGAVKEEVLKILRARLPGTYHHANLLLAATHTHSGPGGFAFHRLYNVTTQGFSEENFQAISEGIAEALIAATANLEAAQIKIAKGELTGASFNRSPPAYMANPEAERQRYVSDVNTTMTLLRFETADKKLLGSLNWFSVHPVSLTLNNHLISGDNKGVASYLHEREQGTTYLKNKEFISAFAQAEAGDVSPYPITDPPLTLAEEFTRLSQHARLQYEKARELFTTASLPLDGPLDYRHQFFAMGSYEVDPQFTGLGEPVKTCPGALGLSFAGGTPNGRPDIALLPSGLVWGRNWPGISLVPELQSCHAEKPVMIPATFVAGMDPWMPQVMPVQTIRLGRLLILAVPFELATMAGRRLREAVRQVVAPQGIDEVVVSSLANEYSHYVTTREEYQVQYYEGASTQFGPWTLAAYQQMYARQAAALLAGEATPSAVWPRYEGLKPSLVQPGVLFDSSPSGQDFGSVSRAPQQQYHLGELVEVGFWGGHPKNDLRRGKTFMEVQQRGPKGWQVRYRDWDFATAYLWQRQGLAASQVTLRWQSSPAEDEAGEYRICHSGEAKPWWGPVRSYEGCSPSFEMVAKGADGPLAPERLVSVGKA